MYLQASRIVETLALQAAFYIACLTSSCLEVLITTSCHHTFLCAESVNKVCHESSVVNDNEPATFNTTASGRCITVALYTMSTKYCYARQAAVLPSDKLLSSLSCMYSKGMQIRVYMWHVKNVGVNSLMQPGREHDAQEFLAFLMDNMMENMSSE